MGSPSLSLDDLAVRCDVGVGTLRVWQQRYGFPLPRRGSRFDGADVARVRRVMELRAHGTRLDAAIDRVLAERAG